MPKVYRFKRDIEETITVSAGIPPEGWTVSGNTIGKNFGWSLGSLGADSADELTNLFGQYRIKGARVKMFFSNTESGRSGSTGNMSNSQLICRMAPNLDGKLDTLDNRYWQNRQAKKYRTCLNGGKPLDIYMPLKQQVVVQNSGLSGAEATCSPKWLPTSDTTVIHYGINFTFERADGQMFPTSLAYTQYCKLITTLYIEMKQVE